MCLQRYGTVLKHRSAINNRGNYSRIAVIHAHNAVCIDIIQTLDSI